MRRRRSEGFACLGVAAAWLAAPGLMSRSRLADDSAAAAADGSDGPGAIVRIVAVEGWATEGFDDLAAEARARLEAPDWGEVRRAMERLGRTELRYGLKIRCLHEDGSLNEQEYLRRPYHEPRHAAEFVRLLRGGPDAAVGLAPGARPWKIETVVDAAAPFPEPR